MKFDSVNVSLKNGVSATERITYIAEFWTKIGKVHTVKRPITDERKLFYVPIYRKTSNIRRTPVGNKIFWSLRCSSSIACRRCPNYIFFLDLIPGFNGLDKYHCMARWETLKVWDLVRLILEIWRYDPLWPAWCHNALRNWSLPQHHAGYRANGSLQKCSEILKFLFSKGCLFVREIKLCTAMTNFSCSTVIWRLLTGLLNNTYKNKPTCHYLGYINIPPLHNSMCYCLFSKLYFHYSCSTHQLHESMTIVCFTCELTIIAYLTERILKYDFTGSRSTMLFHSCNAKYEMVWSQLNIYWHRIWTLPRMMTSSNGHIFRITGFFVRGFPGTRWLPRTNASVAEL